MKKNKVEKVEAYLQIQNNEPVVKVEGREGYTIPETLITFLRKGIKSEQIKACTPQHKNGKTNYIFKVYNEEGKLSYYFVVKVDNKDRYLFKPITDVIKDLSNQSALIKKVNTNRFIAGLSAGILVLTLTGPTLVKGLGNLLEKEKEYDSSRFAPYTQSTPSDEEIKQYEAEYIEDLKARAAAGDESAMEEYNIYLIEQQLKEQNKDEERIRIR